MNMTEHGTVRSKRMVPVVAVMVAVVALLLTGCGIAFPDPNATAHADTATVEEVPSYLFTMRAAAGSTTQLTAEDDEDERFTLSFTDVAQVMTVFTDRPAREASAITVQQFVEGWEATFAESAPNAVLSYLDSSSSTPLTIVTTLYSPVYDAAANTLSFTAVRIYRDVALPDNIQWTRPVTPASFTSPTLFIDSVRICWPAFSLNQMSCIIDGQYVEQNK